MPVEWIDAQLGDTLTSPYSESGTIPPPAIVNAVASAVLELAADLTAIPLDPSTVWTHLHAAGLTR